MRDSKIKICAQIKPVRYSDPISMHLKTVRKTIDASGVAVRTQAMQLHPFTAFCTILGGKNLGRKHHGACLQAQNENELL